MKFLKVLVIFAGTKIAKGGRKILPKVLPKYWQNFVKICELKISPKPEH